MAQVTEQQIIEEFKAIASRILNKQLTTVNLSATFAEMEIDSIQAMEIVGSLEDKYDIEIPDDKLVTLSNIKGLVDLIQYETSKR